MPTYVRNLPDPQGPELEGPVAVPTEEEFQRFRKAVIKKLKYLEGLIDDAFQKINDNDDRYTTTIDEAIDHAARAERAVRRARKALDEHIEEEADDSD